MRIKRGVKVIQYKSATRTLVTKCTFIVLFFGLHTPSRVLGGCFFSICYTERRSKENSFFKTVALFQTLVREILFWTSNYVTFLCYVSFVLRVCTTLSVLSLLCFSGSFVLKCLRYFVDGNLIFVKREQYFNWKCLEVVVRETLAK